MAAIPPVPSYPEGYADPPFDGTIDGFRDVVIPARLKAIEQSLSHALADLLPDGQRLEWTPEPPP